MTRLHTLKPRLQVAKGRIVTLAPVRPDTIERKRGWAGVNDRNRIRKRDCGLCRNCGHVGADVDHDVPLWAGGSDDDSNKQLLDGACHEAKTALEARQRAAGAYDREAVLLLMRTLAAQRRIV